MRALTAPGGGSGVFPKSRLRRYSSIPMAGLPGPDAPTAKVLIADGREELVNNFSRTCGRVDGSHTLLPPRANRLWNKEVPPFRIGQTEGAKNVLTFFRLLQLEARTTGCAPLQAMAAFQPSGPLRAERNPLGGLLIGPR